FFLYLAFQTPHGPLHAKAEDLQRYRGRFNEGWDVLRRRRYERQRAAGLIEPNAGFAPRNPGVPDWASLNSDERELFARYMEVYAALLDNADQNVGRLMNCLRRVGLFDNTLVLLTSDNGANAVAGPSGVMNLIGRRMGATENMALNSKLLRENRVGDADTYICYPTGWTQLSNTPYRYFKRTPMAGGIRVPLVMHWPQQITDPGSIRNQWVHVTDLLPTVAEYTGGRLPDEFNGHRTQPFDGRSFASIANDATAAPIRDRQHYELQGSRAYISGSWKIVSLQTPDKAIDLDNWMLFNIAEDPAEITDLASREPARLRQMIDQFEAEAGENHVYPIDTRDERRNHHVPPYEVSRMLMPRRFYPSGPSVPSLVVSPLVCDRSYKLEAFFSWSKGQEGVIFALGDRFCGLALFVEAGSLHCVYQWWHQPISLPPVSLSEGRQHYRFDYLATGGRKGQASAWLNDKPCVDDIDLSPTMLRIPTAGMSVGLSRRLSVSERFAHRGAFQYPGVIDHILIVPGELAPGSGLEPSEEIAQATIRAAANLAG
ncbi:MAG: sulfatase-like hydrolase/transferase, partial [Betaproteobacteria bacterium]